VTFDEVLEQVRELLQNKGRVSYRTRLKRLANRIRSRLNYVAATSLARLWQSQGKQKEAHERC